MKEEDGVKSAFELAMERISRLPELTPEEKAEQKEREYAPIGQAMAVKYMDGTLTDSDLPVELKRYEGAPQRIVRRALVAGLCRGISFENSRESGLTALKGLMQIAPDKMSILQEAEQGYLKILGDFEESRGKKVAQFEAETGEALTALGISGSAVRMNLDENAQWRQELIRLQQACEPELEGIRNRIVGELASKS